MPQAIQLMSKAAQDAGLSINGTVKEMMDLQQQGALTSSVVLPHFAKRMSEAARANGGLEKALNSNRVAMNQFITSAQMAADTIFRSGLSEGLTDAFKSLGNFFKDNQALWEGLGKVAGDVLSGIAWVIDEIILPPVRAFGRVLNWMMDGFGKLGTVITGLFAGTVLRNSPLVKFFTNLATKFLPESVTKVGIFKTALMSLAKVASKVLLPFQLILGLLEEIALFFNPDENIKTYIGYNINDIAKPMEELLNKVGNIFGMDGVGNQAAVSPNSYLNGGMPKAPTSYNYTTGQNVTLQGDVIINGEKAGEIIGSTTSMSQNIKREMNMYTVGVR